MTMIELTAMLADRYRIEREIGSGGMATVYISRDLKRATIVWREYRDDRVARVSW